MAALARFGMAAVLIVGALFIGMAVDGGLSVPQLFPASPTGYTVSGLMDKKPLEKPVIVNGTVVEIQDDYTSEKGYDYQRFHISDGDERVLVFCSTYGGRVDVSTGMRVMVEGTFQQFYDTYEIYADCTDVTVL